MTKIVQLAGGGVEQQDAYTGPNRELTVDQDNKELRLHDGVTPGGFKILSRDANDARYQFTSPELDGLLDFAPEQRGFLTRLGAANYLIRNLTVNGANLTIQNGNGFDGNPLISLKPVIDSEHTWTGQQQFNDVVQFNAGINADVSGDTFGTHTGPVIGDVTGNVNGNTTGSHVGPVDVRGQSLQLDANQIPTSAINGLLAYIKANAIPIGTITLWSGNVSNIPSGWALCNGASGTPDLRDLFIIGAGGSLTPGATGGATNHGHALTVAGNGAHDHGISVNNHALTLAQIPSHRHLLFANGPSNTYPVTPEMAASQSSNDGGDTKYSIDGNVAVEPDVLKSQAVGGGSPHNHGVSLTGDGSHTHTASAGNANHIPPYMALCYIMKIS